MSFQDLRPGVYSDYVMSARYAQPRSQKSAGLVCQGEVAEMDTVYSLQTKQQAQELLGTAPANRKALHALSILLDAGVRRVELSLAKTDYKTAFARLERMENIGIVVADAIGISNATLGLDSVIRSSQKKRERLLFLGESDHAGAMALAKGLNHERCVITLGNSRYEAKDSSSFYFAVALAGKVLAYNSPLVNLNGLALPAFLSVAQPLKESEIQEAIAAGVTPFETVGEHAECVRGVTTRTMQNNAEDYTLRSVNTILIIDEVLETVRNALTARLKGEGMVAASLESIASQVMVELSEARERGLLSSYDAPRVYSDPSDPEVSIVEIAFHVAHVISQIHIKAHVRL